MDKKDNQRNVNFGFQKVFAQEKSSLVHDIFSQVAQKYDLMNDLMSLGIHRLWKHELCRQIPNLNGTILEVACGSGDIGFKIKKLAKNQGKSPKIIMLDINEDMLKQAKAKALDNNILSNINYICANAEALPLKDNSVDYYIIAFGIRNVTNINKALKEAYRVLKSGGKFLCLEFSKVNNENLKLFYKFYAFNIIPKIGEIVTNNKSAYEYLVESIEMFPDQETFKSLIYEAGLEQVKYQNLSGGIAAIHSAYKI